VPATPRAGTAPSSVCRHLAYLGPSTTLSALLLDPPHGLLHQSYVPRDMRAGGTVNVDGFGVGWYPPDPGPQLDRDPSVPAGSRAALRYRSGVPLWHDTAFATVAAAMSSTAVLAAVRSATVGTPVHAGAAAPFAEGPWLFSHNGVIRGWPSSVVELATGLPVVDLLGLDAPTDSALLWALVRHRLRAGHDPATVLGEVVVAVARAAPGSRLNLLLTDGTTIWATTWTHALSVRASAAAVLVASEPIDDLPGWAEVPDRQLLVAHPGGHRQEALST